MYSNVYSLFGFWMTKFLGLKWNVQIHVMHFKMTATTVLASKAYKAILNIPGSKICAQTTIHKIHIEIWQ